MSYLRTDFDEWEARFSPNGRWVAYQSDETGKSEVYVRSFPDGGGKRQISANGGEAPRWSHDGRELFFVRHQSVHRVQVQTDGPFTAGVPRALFTADLRHGADNWFAVSGQRFFIVPNPTGPMPPALPITVMLNWAQR
jgi:dipeptidyl aminopeptidase/acylaminoacyl peptidase